MKNSLSSSYFLLIFLFLLGKLAVALQHHSDLIHTDIVCGDMYRLLCDLDDHTAKAVLPPLMIYTALRAVMIYQACGPDKKSKSFDLDFLVLHRRLELRTP